MQQNYTGYRRFSFIIIFIAGILGCWNIPNAKISEADAWHRKAEEFLARGNYIQACRAIKTTIQINTEIGRDSVLAENLFQLASVYRILGRYDSVFSTLRDGIEMSRITGNLRQELTGKMQLAEFLVAMRAYSEAASISSEAITIAKFLSDWSNIYAALHVAGRAYHGMGKYAAELEVLQELDDIDRYKLNNRYIFSILEMRINSFADSYNYDSARAVFHRWTATAAGNRDTAALVRAYVLWGRLNYKWKKYAVFSDAFSKALEFVDNCHDIIICRKVLAGMGNSAFYSRQYGRAKRFYREALEYARKANDISIEQFLNLQIVICDRYINRSGALAYTEWLKRVFAVRDTCIRSGFYAGEAYACFLIGRLYDERDRSTDAINYYQRAMEYFDSGRFAGLSDELQIFIDLFIDSERLDCYNAGMKIFYSRDLIENAFWLTESRNLSDIVRYFSKLHVRTANNAANQKLQQIRWTRGTIALMDCDIVRELSAGSNRSPERIEILKDLYPQKLRELSNYFEEIGNIFPNISRLVHLKSFTIRDLQNRLDDEDVLIEYALLRDAVCIFIIRSDTAYMQKVSVSGENILVSIGEYNRLISGTDSNSHSSLTNIESKKKRIGKLSSLLYNILIGPASELLEKRENLIFVSPPEFEWLPFHTLKTGEEPASKRLIQKFDVHYLPSAAAMFFSDNPPKPVKVVVGLGYPGNTDWDVEYELKDIRAFYRKTRLLFNAAATLNNLTRVKCDLLHLSAEFFLDTGMPDNSYMILSGGSVITGKKEILIGDMFEFPPVQTIVFGNVSSDAGGMRRYAPMALLANGTETVIASMWKGERKTRKYFGEIFYTNLLKGLYPEDAYQQAMIALLKHAQSADAGSWGLYYKYGL